MTENSDLTLCLDATWNLRIKTFGQNPPETIIQKN